MAEWRSGKWAGGLLSREGLCGANHEAGLLSFPKCISTLIVHPAEYSHTVLRNSDSRSPKLHRKGNQLVHEKNREHAQLPSSKGSTKK